MYRKPIVSNQPDYKLKKLVIVSLFLNVSYFSNVKAQSVTIPSNIDNGNSPVVIGSGQIGDSGQLVSVNGSSTKHGSLDVKGGGKADLSDGLQVGSDGSSSAGDVTVDGKGSSVTVHHADGKDWAIDVGENGKGNLTISNSASLQTTGKNDIGGNGKPAPGLDGHIVIGDEAGANGTISVNTEGVLAGNAIIIVGNKGTGTLNVDSRGTVSAGTQGIAVGYGDVVVNQQGQNELNPNNPKANDGTGTLNVDGDGSTLHSEGLINIGQGGNGTLKVTSNGKVRGDGGLIEGNFKGSTGTIKIDNATLDVSGKTGLTDGNSVVGVDGKSTLEVTNGGTATFNNGLTVTERNDASGSSASFDHSTLNVSGSTIVGNGGDGTLTLKDQSQDNLGGSLTLGQSSGSTGTVTVSDSKLNVAGLAGIGEQGAGKLTLENSSAQVGALNIGEKGTTDIDGSTLTVGDPSKPAGEQTAPPQGYIRIEAGGSLSAKDGTINVQGLPPQDIPGEHNGFYPIVDVGQTSGSGDATVSLDHSTLNVGNPLTGTDSSQKTGGGMIEVGDAYTRDSEGKSIPSRDGSAGAASLTASNGSNLDGGLAIGVTGGNKSSSVTLSGNSNFNDQGNGLSVGIHGKDNSYTQTGGSMTVGGELDVAGTAADNTADGNGTVTLTNVDAKTKGGYIGLGGTGVMTLSHSTLDSTNLSLGQYDSGNGTLSLNDGTNATIHNGLTVGANGTGTLNMSGNSTASLGQLNVADSKGAAGTINIDGQSQLKVNEPAVIGNGGTAIVNASSGGALTLSQGAVVGSQANSSGVINLKDGASLNAGGSLTHGDGSASMSLTNATLNATDNLYDNVDTNLSGQNNIGTNDHFVAMDSKLSGDGGFDKTGSGILQINNTSNDYHGATNINQGTLEGVGTIGGALNIGNGATLRAGQSINPAVDYGTMNVNGDTMMQSGSTLEANVAGAGPNENYLHSSMLNDKGTFTIQNGTNLDIKVADGAELTINQDYEIVHADKGVEGKFTNYSQDGKIGQSGAFDYGVLYSTGPYYTGKDVQIKWLFDGNKGLGWNGDRNQTGIGNRLSPSVGGDTPLSGIANILAGSDNEQRLHNLTQMDGEIASDMRTGNINNNFWVRDSVNNRLDCLEDTFRQIGNGQTTSSNVCGVTGKKVNVWGNMYGGIGGQNGHSGWDYAAKAKDNDAGFIWGVDGEIGSDGYAEDRWHVGMMMGYGSVMESASGVSSSGESNNANIGMYFGKQVRFDNQNFFTFHGQFGYTWNIMSWHRSVNLEGAASQYNQSLHANELGGTAHVNAEIAYKHVFNLWGTPLELAPTGSITYLNYEQGSYHEHGGDLALQGRATNTNMGYGFMGMKLATNFNIGNVVITPHGKFGYRRSFGANQSYTHVGFEALGGGNTGIDPSIVGVPVVQDQALTELGFDVHPTDYLTFGANYVGLYGGHEQTMSGGQLTAKIAF